MSGSPSGDQNDEPLEGDFNWSRDADVVVHSQDAIAVYPNKHGAVVVRCERTWDEERDPTIIIAREHVIRIVQAILEAAGLGDIPYDRGSVEGGIQDVPIATAEVAGPGSQGSRRSEDDGPNTPDCRTDATLFSIAAE
jgi:hypothetical protein